MSGPHRVAILVRHGVLPLELGLVHQLFGAARSRAGAALYEVVTCAVEAGPVRTDADFTVDVQHDSRMLACADTVIVPASHEQDETITELPPGLARALSGIRPGTRIASVCTGAFVLAAAGLLDGARATTHWKSAELFRERYPGIHLDADVLYVDAGGVLTSAGEAAGIDLCLHMIRSDHGASVANDVARATVVPPHRPGGQAQYIRLPVADPGAASTGQARSWALNHLDRPITVTDLAARSLMSVRTFTRRFRDEVGTSPAQWLIAQRLDRARQLLEDTDLPVDRVAQDAGFGTAVSLRQHLDAALGVTPTSYRATFRGVNPRQS
ncbi:MAG TPA: helix-turn-helix domain-containing protein [Pseudonocardiaceae bacterium]|jgi:transcriptional regulator GlxA family with amidase domain|nr:helix-turn-helix domain-containing protein [Pseudonocardiaceae bacterium]